MPNIVRNTVLGNGDQLELKVCWERVTMPNNCGITVIAGIGAYHTRHWTPTPGTWPSAKDEPITLRQIFEFLDEQDIVRKLGVCYGMFVLTDRIAAAGIQANMVSPRGWAGADDIGPEDLDAPIFVFKVRDFVRYLISRKVGSIYRGPVTRNINHSDHAICTWVWVPETSLLLYSKLAAYNRPKDEELPKANERAIKCATQYLKLERASAKCAKPLEKSAN